MRAEHHRPGFEGSRRHHANRGFQICAGGRACGGREDAEGIHSGGESTAGATELLFGGCRQRVTFRRLALEPAARERLRRRLGYLPPRPSYVVYVASTGERTDGYAIVDEEMGQHEMIGFAVKLSPSVVVERQEIVAYRESRGDEVTDPRFRGQFVGKSGRDPLRLSVDIAAISGATISSASMASGVRRAIALVEELVQQAAPQAESRGGALVASGRKSAP